jgi:16S rRNA (guanine527-N7)-methyltransferase
MRVCEARWFILNSMDAAAIRDLLAPFLPTAEIDDGLLVSVETHLELLIRWNQRMNLTAVRSPQEMVTRHFGESLFAARELCSRDRQSLIDVGSGAGFPGLPIKYWAPQLQVTLIESHGKKATFLREVGRALHLTDFTVLNVRAESSSLSASLVTLRAVERFDQALPSAARLVAPNGKLAILIGEPQLTSALSLLPPGTHSTIALPNSEQRILLTWQPSRQTIS